MENQAIITEYILSNEKSMSSMDKLFSVSFYSDNTIDKVIENLFDMNSTVWDTWIIILKDLKNDLIVNANVEVESCVKINAKIVCSIIYVTDNLLPYLHLIESEMYEFITPINDNIVYYDITRLIVRESDLLPSKNLLDVFPDLIVLIVRYGKYECDDILMNINDFGYGSCQFCSLKINTHHELFSCVSDCISDNKFMYYNDDAIIKKMLATKFKYFMLKNANK